MKMLFKKCKLQPLKDNNTSQLHKKTTGPSLNKLIPFYLKQKTDSLKTIGFYLINKFSYLRVFTDCFAYPFSGSIASVLLNNSIAFTLSVLA
jgi:hypothetical protein